MDLTTKVSIICMEEILTGQSAAGADTPWHKIPSIKKLLRTHAEQWCDEHNNIKVNAATEEFSGEVATLINAYARNWRRLELPKVARWAQIKLFYNIWCQTPGQRSYIATYDDVTSGCCGHHPCSSHLPRHSLDEPLWC